MQDLNIQSFDDNNQFKIVLEGFEGPIDLLLELAKKQKVDLSEISILELAQQYLNFIQKYKEYHLEIAADYLVMAAWLTFLKSRLLLPKEKYEEEHSPEQLEAAFKYQLQRLEAMQNISKVLYERPIINRDVFYRGVNNNIKVKYIISYRSTLFDLLKSYSSLFLKKHINSLKIQSSDLYTVDEAINRLKNIFVTIKEWTDLMNLLPSMVKDKIINKSAISSNFVASLELTKNGNIEVKQKEAFGNIYVRAKQS